MLTDSANLTSSVARQAHGLVCDHRSRVTGTVIGAQYSCAIRAELTVTAASHAMCKSLHLSGVRWAPPAMPAEIPCALCGIVGFVRAERVITGEKITIEYHCGRCERAWSVTQDERRGLPDRRQAPRTERRKPREPTGIARNG